MNILGLLNLFIASFIALKAVCYYGVEATKRYPGSSYGYNGGYYDQDSSGWLNIGGHGQIVGGGGYLSLGGKRGSGYDTGYGTGYGAYGAGYGANYNTAYGAYNGYGSYGSGGYGGGGGGGYNAGYGAYNTRPIYQTGSVWGGGSSYPYSSHYYSPYSSSYDCTGVLGNTLGGGGLLSSWLLD